MDCLNTGHMMRDTGPAPPTYGHDGSSEFLIPFFASITRVSRLCLVRPSGPACRAVRTTVRDPYVCAHGDADIAGTHIRHGERAQGISTP